MDLREYRRENLRKYIDDNGGPRSVAQRLGYDDSSFLVQMTGPNPSRDVSEKTARSYEAMLELAVGTFDQVVEVTNPRPTGVAERRRRARAKLRPSQPISVEQVVELIGVVGRICTEQDAVLTTSKFADIVALTLLDSASNSNIPREDHIKALVRLAR